MFTNSNNNNNNMPHTMIADSTEHGNGEWQEEPKNRTENQMRRKKSAHTSNENQQIIIWLFCPWL